MSGGEIVLLVVLVGFFVLCIVMAVSTSRGKKKHMKAMKAKGASCFVNALHTTGLPLAENVPCQILSLQDTYKIESNGTEFNLAKDKVTDICITTDSDIQKHYVSSAGGAVGGALLFGPVGALIGGRAKEKTTKTVDKYLIFTYLKEDSIEYIAFNVNSAFKQAQRVIDEFKKNAKGNTVKKQVDL